MTTKLKIIDKVFDLIGVKPEDRNVGGEAFRRVNLFYGPVRDEMLRARKWDFAAKKCILKNIAHNRYEYPQDALFIIGIVQKSDSSNTFQEKYNTETQKREIITTIKDPCAVYIARVEEKDFTDDFIEVFSLALACDLCVCILGNINKQLELQRKLFLKLGEINEISDEQKELV